MTMSNFFSRVFLWMFVGLMVTFATGVIVSNSASALNLVFSSGSLIILFIIEFATVIILSSRLNKMSVLSAQLGFIFYAFITGLTFSSVFVIYNVTSIISIFLIASLIMLVFALIGAKTNIDLTKFGTYLMMILLGIIIASVINIFVGSEIFNLGLNILGLIIFIGYIAYDVQKLKILYEQNLSDEKLAIYGALQLYLDFINIFLHLLELFGNSNRD